MVIRRVTGNRESTHPEFRMTRKPQAGQREWKNLPSGSMRHTGPGLFPFVNRVVPQEWTTLSSLLGLDSNGYFCPLVDG